MNPERAEAAPRATYRVQLTADFTFDHAAAIAGYLAEMGISHMYISPCLQAAPGSAHGYDVTDPSKISDALGGEAGLRRLGDALAQNGLGLLMDIVPNHMAADAAANPLWRDVLEKGPSSTWASFFDIDWNSPCADLRGKVLLPVLGTTLEEAARAGKIRLGFRAGRFFLQCEGGELPLASESAPKLADEKGGPPAAAEINRDPAKLARLLSAQHYLLACWREANRRVNYRRFFSVAGLVGVRVEDERVFRHVHARALEWAAEGLADGLRVDHIDGLRDPETYLRRLRESCPDQWIVVEKILGAGEALPESWPVDGTTGYDFLNQVERLLADPAGEAALTDFYARFTGQETGWANVAHLSKAEALDSQFHADLERLVRLAAAISRDSEKYRGLAVGSIRDALREVIVALPVYRTYVYPGRPSSPRDRAIIAGAIAASRPRRPDVDALAWDFLGDLLQHCPRGEKAEDFILRLQQLTGPVAARGVEDTALYRYNRLACLNDVGGDPGLFSVTVDEFHRFCQDRRVRWPRTLLATSTHDAKRSEDVRARIIAISEMPGLWESAVTRWSAMNQPRRGNDAPSRNDEYLFYQTLVGAWPISEERLAAYMVKAAREAKARTSWTDPDATYEDAIQRFVAGALADAGFLADMEAFLRPLLPHARTNSLTRTLIKCTAPGVADFYQGTELWDLSLVDPDNRRPVDYGLRRRLLSELPSLRPADAMARAEEGLPKLMVIQRALALRRRRPDIFGPESDYRPLQAKGPKAAHVVAFVRGEGAAIVAPRLTIRVAGDWAGTILPLPEGTWTDEFTGRQFSAETPLAELLGGFPAALLTKGKA
jgi:(1->4)-alpha-D-glucan 1-alpha-D-glucosylmutase